MIPVLKDFPRIPAPVMRPFQMEDFDRAYELWAQTEGVGLTESDTPEMIASFLERNPGLSWVAVSGDRLVGTVLCGHDGRRASLYHLAVAEDFRRFGLGRALVDRSLAALKSAGIAKCRVFFFAANVEGQAFWRRIGWVTRDDVGWAEIMTGGKPD